MKTKKKFDCVKMKHDIQNKINKEFEGVSDEEKYKIILKRIKKNPLLSRLIPS